MQNQVVQYIHSATLDSATVNSEASKQCNINSEIQNSATLFSAT